MPACELCAGLPAAEAPEPSAGGSVALVGAGPGDPELLTLKALRRLQAADVVLHDSLLSEDILALVPASAELINVGKRCGDVRDRGLQQREIHELMLANCRRGCRVVRLKCGDPLVFGRGGEELEFLAKHGVQAEVVPGVTSAVGAAASCQMPLTHRELGASSVRLVTGQSQAKRLPELDWPELAKSAGKQTTVFYMGLKLLGDICGRLLEHGAPGATPMALVESATTPEERATYGTLESMPKIARERQVGASGAPVILFLGPCASFPAHLEKLSGGRPWKRMRAMPADEC